MSMTRSTFSTWTGLGVSLLFAIAAAPAADISPYTIENGGVTSAGGTFVVTGSIGQPNAGEMSGGVFILSGGFWTSTHPFVPVELQSFEVAEVALPAQTPAVRATPLDPVRAVAVLMNRIQETSLTSVDEGRPIESREDPADDPDPTTTN